MEKPNPLKRPVVNIGLNKIIKSIKCDHPCSEGFEVENLVSYNNSSRNNGFLVERFIKPPVTITLELTNTIDLKYVFLQCSVGAQKSSGIELLIQPLSKENPFESVSSGVIKADERGFVFHRYSENLKDKFGEVFRYCSFKSSRSLSRVSSIKIKIFRTQGASIPALGKLEVWGVPKKLDKADLRSSTNQGQNLTQPCHPLKCTTVNSSLRGNDNCTKSKPSIAKDNPTWPVTLQIPNDFIDPITCDLMCQPITLPSGNIIDVSTLESFEKAESQWGRVSSDPFTGIPFTNSSKPIAASDLKSRIDKFLCDNSDHPDLKTIPRTVGRSLAHSRTCSLNPSMSKLIIQKRHTMASTNDRSSTDDSYFEGTEKRRKIEQNIRDFLSSREMQSPQQNDVRKDPVSEQKKHTHISFQEKMEKSLELSLRSTLSSLPSFTVHEKKCEKTLVECNVCKSSDQLFSIPCSHFICRKCLITLKTKGEMSCQLCKSSFGCNNVQKVHLK